MTRPLTSERGVALFLVLWILALLSVVVGEFCHTMRAEVNMTGNFSYGTKAYYAAYAGIQQGIKELVRSVLTPASGQKEPTEEGAEKIEWRINAEIPPIQYGNEYFQVRLDNESGKININTANSSMLRIMLATFKLDDHEKDVIVDSILDWRDKDHFHRLNGAEDDYYKDLAEPYPCKDGDFDSVEELRLVRGVNDEIYYGGLRDMVTVVGSRIPVKKSSFYRRININAASARILASLPMMTDDMVKEIQDYRAEKDFTYLGELVSIIGRDAYQAAARYLTVTLGPYYTIRSTGFARDKSIKEIISAVVKIDAQASSRYRILEWNDASDDKAHSQTTRSDRSRDADYAK